MFANHGDTFQDGGHWLLLVWLDFFAHSLKDAHLGMGGIWYGLLEGEPSQLLPQNPLDLVDQLNGPVLGLYEGKDRGISLDSVNRMNTALKSSGSVSEIRIYDQLQHGFQAD